MPWLESPPDAVHARAADAIEFMWGLDPDLVSAVVAFPWVADGVSYEETEMLIGLAEISYVDLRAGKRLVDTRWVADGQDDGRALWELIPVAYLDPTVAQAAADYANNEPGDQGWYVADAFQSVSTQGRDALGKVAGQLGVADGISDEEAVLITLAGGFYHCDRTLYQEIGQ